MAEQVSSSDVADPIHHGESPASRFWSAVPVELRKEFEAVCGISEQGVPEEAVRCFVNRKLRRVPLDDFDPYDRGLLIQLDTDNDGSLSYNEVVEGAKLLLMHKKKYQRLWTTLLALLVVIFVVLGAIFGLVYVIVDMQKDTQSVHGQLVSRANGLPLQVGLTDMIVVDGVLTGRSQASTDSLGTSGAHATIRTAQVLYTHDGIHSDLSNDEMIKIDHIAIKVGSASNSPIVSTKVEGFIRFAVTAEDPTRSIVLVATQVGRFLVNGSTVSLAQGIWANMSIDDIYDRSIRTSVQSLAARRSVQLKSMTIATCSPESGCISTTRRDETACCVGQIVKCSFVSSPNELRPCGPKQWCFWTLYLSAYRRGNQIVPVETVVVNPCTDLIIFGPEMRDKKCNGVYSLFHTLWDNYPVYWNQDKDMVMVYDKIRTRWVIIAATYFNEIFDRVPRPSIQVNQIVVISAATSITNKAWPGANTIAYTMSTSKFGVYCPGSGSKVIIRGIENYFDQPYLRMCAPGYYCQTTTSQLKCDDLEVRTWSESVKDNFVLSSRLLLNGFPIYIAVTNKWFLGMFKPGTWCFGSVSSNDPLLNSSKSILMNPKALNLDDCQTYPNEDPKKGWENKYKINYFQVARTDRPFCPGATRFRNCAIGYTWRLGDVPEWGSINGRGSGEKVSDCDECARMCTDFATCLSYECSPSRLDCNLNIQRYPDPNAPQPPWDQNFCTKTGCAPGYRLQDGDILGWGIVNNQGGGVNVQDCDECANMCSRWDLCLSYECSSPGDSPRCNLNDKRDPTISQSGDQLFCSKAACARGYSLQIGDIPGSGRIDGKGGDVDDCNTCAQWCSERSACLSYECSHTALKCNLNTQPDASDVQAGDQVFCSKDGCSTGYQLQVGDVPGMGKVGNLGGGQLVAHCGICAQWCASLSDCNSYECSSSSTNDLKQCNLNVERYPTAGVPNNPDYNFCTKTGCATGYTLQVGDVPGWGWLVDDETGEVIGGETYIVSGCQVCADKCTKLQQCMSYECSPTRRQCNLNTLRYPAPTSQQAWDQLVCSKVGCGLGYLWRDGHSTGVQTVNNQGGGEIVSSCNMCAQKCSDLEKCLSYECSPSTRKCYLNTDRNPSTARVEDQRYCTKMGCAQGYKWQIGDIPGWGKVDGRGGGERVSDCAICAKICTSIKTCLSYECAPSTLRCNLNNLGDPTIFQAEDQGFCTKIACDTGYLLQLGDVLGAGVIDGLGGGQIVNTCIDCARLCSRYSSCLSYECSPSTLQCNLNTQREPNSGQAGDQYFCSKTGCAAGYILQFGDVPGWGMISGQGGGMFVDSCAVCAQLCSARSTCRSYECTPSARLCSLNTERDPAPGSSNPGDQGFCSKPGCAPGYTWKDGDVPGLGAIGDKGNNQAVKHCTECAVICNSLPSCLSYECSHTTRMCNVNTQRDTTLGSAGDQDMCVKTGCDIGYISKLGDVVGAGKIGDKGGGQSVNSCIDCADFCWKAPECLSYECSPTLRICNLNRKREYDYGQYLDYGFCVKPLGLGEG